MKFLRVLVVLWVAVVSVFAAVDLSAGNINRSVVALSLSAAFLYVIFARLGKAPWAWWASLVPPTISLGLYAPMTFYNFWRGFKNDPIFLDSPGTALVVLIYAFVYVFPAMLILTRLIVMRGTVSPNDKLQRTRGGSFGEQ